ncbi:serine hydrolase domain-containing protein [Thalassotalea ganghwensis]
MLLKKYFTFVISLLIFIITTTPLAKAKTNQSLKEQINTALVEEKLVGISWATVSNGVVEVGSAGSANLALNQAMTADHKVHVGSVAKSVLALGVLRLITENKLSLDTNVEQLLPELAFKNPWSEGDPITVRHLLEHSAGLDNIRMWQLLNTRVTPTTPLKEAFAARDSELLKVRTKPGTQYSYSNMGYAILGMVIEKVTNQAYEQYLDNHLLKPLSMSDSTFVFLSQEGENADASLAMGYFEGGVAQPAVATYLRPAGQFTTTAADMAKFINLINGQGVLNERVFIKRELIEALAVPHATDAVNAGLEIGHGLAFVTRDRHHVIGMCHPGSTFGYYAYTCIYPEQQKGYFFSINTDSESANTERFNQIFIQHLALEPSAKVSASTANEDLSTLEGMFFLSPNNVAEFEFVDRVFQYRFISVEENQLIIKSLEGKDKILEPIGHNRFREQNRHQVSHVFFQNADGELMLTTGLKTYKKGAFVPVLLYWLSIASGLFGFAYVLFVGMIRLIKRDIERFNRVGLTFINLILFIVPIVLFINQSFLRFGDVTAASLSLAVLSGGLLLSIIASLYVCVKKSSISKTVFKMDVIALLLSLQFCIVLLLWQQIPVVFWR